MGKTMKIEVITSFDQRYHDLIGHRCVSSWLEHWPQDLALTCYVENMRLPEQRRINQVDFEDLGDRYRDFQSAAVKSRVLTFAKKAFSVIHAMHHSTADRIMWLDADVLTTQPVDHDILARVMPGHVVSTHLGVWYDSTKQGIKGRWLVPETGVFVLNTRHSDFETFRREYSRRYWQQDFAGLRRSYDNDVYGAVISQHALSSLDLCEGLKKSYKTPLKHTVLGPYLQHYKAKHSKDWFAQAADQ